MKVVMIAKRNTRTNLDLYKCILKSVLVIWDYYKFPPLIFLMNLSDPSKRAGLCGWLLF